MREPKPFGLNELREMFLSFFESKGHLRLPSFSLIPQNDASLLLINSGMAPMKPWFTGEQEPPRHRVCTCQKCIRTGDIENIGKTARHGTYFEMLGNFSFGDYFKREAIAWSWEFLTSPEWVGLDPDRLYPSVFEGNETTPKILALKAALESQQVASFIESKYSGSVVSTVDHPGTGYDDSVDYEALKGQTITVAASPTPHAEILEVVKEILAAKGITLDIQVYNDYVVPNTVVDDGTVDANYFQHLPYLEDFNAENNTHIVSVSAIHVEPMGLYGGRQTSLDALKASK